MTGPPVALTIAGSDSGGGAGIQADLATFTAHGVHGTTAITAITAQNTLGVTAIHQTPPHIVAAQLDAILTDFSVTATKTGMLGDPAIAELIAGHNLRQLVVDPVMVATSGSTLYQGKAATFLNTLGPHTTVLTPNIPEAETLTGRPIHTLAHMRDAATALADHGPRAVIVKGGHTTGEHAIDIAWCDGELHELAAERVITDNTHGTGCTLSAAITAGLAHGRPLQTAIAEAKTYVTAALRRAAGHRLGSGPGPLQHRCEGNQ